MVSTTNRVLALAGLEYSDVALLSPTKFAHVWRTRGWLLAVLGAWRDLATKSLWLAWRVFAPYVLVRQILAVLVLQLLHDGVVPLVRSMLRGGKRHGTGVVPDDQQLELARLDKEMELAQTYFEWRDAARLHSAILTRAGSGAASPLPLPPAALDRVRRMEAKTATYTALVQRGDLAELQFRLRSELHRKQWGLGGGGGGGTGSAGDRTHPHYREALNAYLTSVCDALALLAKGQDNTSLASEIDQCRTRITFFSETLHSFGRTALMLSGGARLGLQHLGVIKALRDQKLIPRVISGSSAGSIVAVLLAAFRDDELDDKLFNPHSLNLKFFEFVDRDSSEVMEHADPAKQPWLSSLLLLPPPFPSLFHAFNNVLPTYWKTGALLNVHVLAKAIRDSIGDMTFLEAFHRTGRIINITVSPSATGSAAAGNDFPMLLNYLTAPQVVLWSASVASCAIPGVFAPVELLAKDKTGDRLVPYYPEGMKWADGSVEADLPMQRLAELFNVNNFIVSQVNPHARFLAPIQTVHQDDGLEGGGGNGWFELGTKVVVDFCRDQCRSSVKHFASTLMSLPEIPLVTPVVRGVGRSLVPILTQKYTGDLTIMPPLSLRGMATILVNPSPEEFVEDIVRGERITWPHISRLRMSVAIEFLLDDCRQSCLAKLAVLSAAAEASPGSPRLSSLSSSRKLAAIPTASVLNLEDIASLQKSSSPKQPKEQQQQQVSMQRMNSLVTLSNKLKDRVESFAEDLSVMRDVEAKFNRRLNHGNSVNSHTDDSMVEEEEEDEDGPQTF